MRYSSIQIGYSIAVHEDAVTDLEKIYLVDEDSAADIEVFLEEAKNNQKLLDTLTVNKYVNYEDTPYDVKELIELKKKKFNYDIRHEVTKRIIAAYCDLDIARI